MALCALLLALAAAAAPGVAENPPAPAEAAPGSAAGPSLEADDECMADGSGDRAECSLSALQYRALKRTAAGGRAHEGCHDMKEGDGGECWKAIQWARNEGFSTHPEWYPGLDPVKSTLEQWQFAAYNTSHPKCPRPCSMPAKKLWCNSSQAPKLWSPTSTGGPVQVKVLSYNLFWWHLYGVQNGAGDSAGRLIQDNMQPQPFDVMGFQECEDPEKVLAPVGLLDHYAVFQGDHAICMAYRKSAWSLIVKGETNVAEDMSTEYYGTRGTQWMRLRHTQTGMHLFFVNHHGPLSVNSGGLCGGMATAHNILKVMKAHAEEGDLLILAGDFNANAASLTIQSLWPHLTQVFNSASFGGVDNIFSNVGRGSVMATTDLGSGGSDHHAIGAVVEVGAPSLVQEDSSSLEEESCHTASAADGGSCWKAVQWAMHTGLAQHPSWYPGLDHTSSAAQFQHFVHKAKPSECPAPCSSGAASAPHLAARVAQPPQRQGVPAEPGYSVEVLAHAHGSDGCLIEPETQYVFSGGWTRNLPHVTDPRSCCTHCQGEPACKAWTWTDWAAAASGPQCSLKGGKVTQKLQKDGSVSGLPQKSAVPVAKSSAHAAIK